MEALTCGNSKASASVTFAYLHILSARDFHDSWKQSVLALTLARQPAIVSRLKKNSSARVYHNQ